MCVVFFRLMSTCISFIVRVAIIFLSIGLTEFMTYMIDPPPLLDAVGLSTEKILWPWMETSASRCLSRVSSHVPLSPMMSSCSIFGSAINSSIFGGNDWTLAESTLSVFGCVCMLAWWRWWWW